MKLSRCALGTAASIRESEFLTVTCPAGLFPIHGHPAVVEKITSEFDFDRAHRIIGRNSGTRETLGKVPVENGARQAGRDGESESDSLSLWGRMPSCARVVNPRHLRRLAIGAQVTNCYQPA